MNIDDVTRRPKPASGGAKPENLDMILNVAVEVTAKLGSCTMTLSEVLSLAEGTIVQLKQKAAEPVLLCLNDKVVARGEVVMVENCFGIKITEMVES